MTNTINYAINSTDTLYDAIISRLANASTNDIVQMWNAFCDEELHDDDRIYFVEELNDLLWDKKPLEIISLLHPEFSENDTYCYFDENGYLNSFDDWSFSENPIYIEDMAEASINNYEDYGDGELETLINEYLEYLDSKGNGAV